MPAASEPLSLADQNEARKAAHAASSQADAAPLEEEDHSDSGTGRPQDPDGTAVVPSPS